MIEFETEVLNVIRRTYNVKSFRFKYEGEPCFKPGQFFFVTIEVEGEKLTKHFSFSNSPTERGYIEFTKKITESAFSRALDRLKVGNKVFVKLPYGSFTFEGEYEKIALLSGGIGITPIRSICKFATDRKLPADIILLYGNNKEEDIIFREDFDKMHAAEGNIRVVYTLTSAEADKNRWRGRTGYIDERMVKEEIADYRERIFFVCGPPAMVKALVDILRNRLYVAEDRIKTEKFIGY